MTDIYIINRKGGQKLMVKAEYSERGKREIVAMETLNEVLFSIRAQVIEMLNRPPSNLKSVIGAYKKAVDIADQFANTSVMKPYYIRVKQRITNEAEDVAELMSASEAVDEARVIAIMERYMRRK